MTPASVGVQQTHRGGEGEFRSPGPNIHADEHA